MMPYRIKVVLACLIGPAVVIAMCLLAFPAWAQTNCSSREAALNAAKKLHNETPAFFGAANAGTSVIVTISPKGSWSIFACTQTKCCLMAGGQTATFLRGA